MNEQKPKPEKRAKTYPAWVRITISVIRAVLIPFLCVIALLTGLWIGYVYIGGRSSSDVWNWETWRHLFDLVFAS